MKQDDDRGSLVGAFIVVEGDEVLAIKQSGQVTRSAIDEHLRCAHRVHRLDRADKLRFAHPVGALAYHRLLAILLHHHVLVVVLLERIHQLATGHQVDQVVCSITIRHIDHPLERVLELQ